MCTHPPQEPRKTPQLLIVATDVSHGGHHLQWYERKQVVIGQGVQAGSCKTASTWWICLVQLGSQNTVTYVLRYLDSKFDKKVQNEMSQMVNHYVVQLRTKVMVVKVMREFIQEKTSGTYRPMVTS